VGCKLLLGTLLLTSLFGCSFNKLESEIERAYVSYGYIKLFAPSETQAGGQTLIALYAEGPGKNKLLQMRTLATGEAAVFFVPVADYRVAAFEDSNGDGTDKLTYFCSKSGSLDRVSPRKLAQSGAA